jgi:hypothetical protein
MVPFSSVLIPRPSPFRMALNCFGDDITGPRSSLPYFMRLPRLKSHGTAKQNRKMTITPASISAEPYALRKSSPPKIASLNHPERASSSIFRSGPRAKLVKP